ncbi:uncharacterized protein LOC143918851 [Arctopsyche grandis]|uniref:uncharacterized protein LOC143918851 n=1 Tax=Arctopsyche grandis TaxID=121162 RepID=UPI00406D9A62
MSPNYKPLFLLTILVSVSIQIGDTYTMSRNNNEDHIEEVSTEKLEQVTTDQNIPDITEQKRPLTGETQSLPEEKSYLSIFDVPKQTSHEQYIKNSRLTKRHTCTPHICRRYSCYRPYYSDVVCWYIERICCACDSNCYTAVHNNPSTEKIHTKINPEKTTQAPANIPTQQPDEITTVTYYVPLEIDFETEFFNTTTGISLKPVPPLRPDSILPPPIFHGSNLKPENP